MTIYTAKNKESPITAMEFQPSEEGDLVFLRLASQESVRLIQRWCAHDSDFTWVGQSKVDGAPLVVLKSELRENELLRILTAKGIALTPEAAHTPLDPWVVRSVLGFTGQLLQLASSLMRSGGKVDSSIFLFASSNLTANVINFVYKGQEHEDPYRLAFLKEQTNARLAATLSEGEIAPGVKDHRLFLRKEYNHDVPLGEKLNRFMQKYSVNVGELGLRYLGAFGLAFPPNQWSPALLAGKMPAKSELLNSSALRVYAGVSSIAGKTIALTSQIEDPYNPKPTSWVDKLREKWAFLLGGWVEVTSFSALAYDALVNSDPQRNPGRGIMWNGKPCRDWLGGIGAGMFVLGYISRSWAKYGTRRVDMPELYAHISDTLAKSPPGKIPQLLVDVSAQLAEHFNKKNEASYGEIYKGIAHDLQSHHRINIMDLQAASANETKIMVKKQLAEVKNDAPQRQIFGAVLEQRVPVPSLGHGTVNFS